LYAYVLLLSCILTTSIERMYCTAANTRQMKEISTLTH